MPTAPRIDFDLEFDWQNLGRGSLRLAHVTLLGEAFDEDSLSFAAHNGGRTPDRFALKDQTWSMARRCRSWCRPPAAWA